MWNIQKTITFYNFSVTSISTALHQTQSSVQHGLSISQSQKKSTNIFFLNEKRGRGNREGGDKRK